MKVLVTGGRDFSNKEKLFKYLEHCHNKKSIQMIIHGGAPGADTLAGMWAEHRGIHVAVVKALWKYHGRWAGPIRNKAMLNILKPDLVIVFEGGSGTRNCQEEALRAGIKTIITF